MTRHKKGLNARRLPREPEERLFATAWDKVNYNGVHLDYMLDPYYGGKHKRPRECSERDQEVASTFAQWLGTNCGRNFLARCGYVKADEQTHALKKELEALKGFEKLIRGGKTSVMMALRTLDKLRE